MEWIKATLRNILIYLGFINNPALVTELLEEHPLPENIQAGVVYILHSGGYQKWAVFRCPEQEDEIIQLCLMEKRRPRWTVRTDWLGRPTINPSVRQLDGSCAHFWVKTGYVEWCADSDFRPNNIARN